MASRWFACASRLFFFLCVRAGCDEYRKTVHVSLFGNDTKYCGAIEKPCRTIAMAVSCVAWDGRVILNGSGTAKQPYTCKGLNSKAHYPGIRVSRNVTMTSLHLTEAHVTCRSGFYFHQSNKRLRITLSGITFLKTPLEFRDCSHVEVINCKHQDTPEESAVFIRVENSSKMNVTVRNSLFQNNSLSVKIQFEQCYIKADVVFSLNIHKTKFLENGFHTKSQQRGAVLFSNHKEKFSRNIHLFITVEKVQCVGGGGHFLNIDLPTAVTKETYTNINLERNHFKTCRSLYYSRVKMASVTFFRLQCNNNSDIRCITIQSFTKANKTVDLNVHGSRFYDNRTNRTKFAAIFRVTGFEAQSGMINISNTSFVRNYKFAVSITPNFKLRLDGVTVASSLLGVRIVAYDKVAMNESNFHLDVSINNCIFRNNLKDLFGLLNNSIYVRFRVTNTLFDGKKIQERDQKNSTFGIRIIIPPLNKTFSSEAHIDMENVTFHGRPANSFIFVFKGKKRISVRGCKFRNGFSLEKNEWRIRKYRNLPGYITGQGALLFLFDADELVDKGCVKEDDGHNTHPKWNYTSRVLFEDTLFQNNYGYVAGAIQIINGYVKFQRCQFTDNFALGDTGHIYVGYGSAKVEFQSCVFKRTERKGTYESTPFAVGRFLHSESGGPIKIENTSFVTKFSQRLVPQPILRIFSGGYFDIDLYSTIRCAAGSALRFDNFSHFHYEGGQENTFCRINVTTVMFTCRMCPPRMYSFQSGFSRGFMVRKGFECLECPFGAECNGPNNIVAKRDFWGYKVTNASNFSSLAFLPCPEEYCRKPTRSSYHEGYDRCYGNRSGVLCGRCAPGFTETLFSPECRKSEECGWSYLLWLLMVLYTIGLTFYLLKKPPIVHILKDQIFWFGKNRQKSLDGRSVHKSEDENGYLEITFYFYQVVDLLSTTSLENMMSQVPYISTIVAAFNFEVRVVDEGIGCPFPGLTAVTKEVFLSALVFAAIAHVFVIYCVHLAVNRTLKRGKPLLVHYVAVAMEIMLLGYERLAETSLRLLHCVSIGSEWHLYFDGNIVCWQWWQYGLLAFNAIFVVPFVGVLYLGSGKLYNKTISWKEFVGACVVPLPFLVYWLLKSLCTRQIQNPADRNALSCEYTSLLSLHAGRRVSRDSDECTNEISHILHGPFRPPSAHDQGTLYWESVLIGRRLVLLTCRAFIPNSMICFLCMSVACVLMLVHHLIMKPFHDRAADRLETLSLITLSCIAIINVTTATLASSAVRPEGPDKHIIVVLQRIQVAVVCFPPAVFAMLILFAFLSQAVRLAMFLKRKICILRMSRQKRYYQYLNDSVN